MTRQIPLVKERLRELRRPASISEIGDGLQIPERTLRRWLGRLVDNGFAQAYGQKKGRRYVISELADQSHPTAALNNTQTAHSTRAWSADKADTIKPTGNAQELPRYLANETAYLSTQQLQRLRTAAIEINFDLALDDHGIIDTAFHSGRLDGNQCSHGETERLWYEGLNENASLDRDQVRSLNQLEACRSLFRLDASLPIANLVSGERLRGLNYLLTDGLIETRFQGAYRRVQHEKLQNHDQYDNDVAQQLRSLLNLAHQIVDPFEQSLFLLAYITRLAPFHSANAATARAAANLTLLKHRLPPMIFSECQRDHYEYAFSQLLEQHDISDLIKLFITTYEQDCLHFKAGQQSTSADTVRIRYRQQRRHLIREIISQPGSIDSFKQYISQWACNQIPSTQREAFIQETINDLARLAPFNLAAFGISDDQWQQWRQYCLERGIRFKTQRVA